MRVELKFTETKARVTRYYLRRRYKSKAELSTLIKRALIELVGLEAQRELDAMDYQRRAMDGEVK